MKKEGYPKSIRLKKETDFRQTLLQGIKRKGELLTVFRLKREDEMGVKVGIKLGKGIDRAVMRNRIKRSIREVLRRNRGSFNPNENIVILCRSAAKDIDPERLKQELLDLIQ